MSRVIRPNGAEPTRADEMTLTLLDDMQTMIGKAVLVESQHSTGICSGKGWKELNPALNMCDDCGYMLSTDPTVVPVCYPCAHHAS